MEFEQLISNIMDWIRDTQDKYKEKLNIEFIKEEASFLHYIIESKSYLAEIVIEPKGFHPHRHVWFEALDKNKDISQIPYIYVDDENASLTDILNNLNKQIAYIIK